ncbi:WecB/TagA/CpsF family glycosyltransferase [uncultured Draconibacterium sp.]|uniref:WecB/TagA/CpsF family glycosyltransferase n=1 Tax=uncultured Draconibacterium sp. TaxID=1573823 RepID=UPI0029C6E845|nr:WecB/TagA/CpsF family glycosyltransferase [uncultured Draconibacterium sp.]
MRDRFKIQNVGISITDLNDAVKLIMEQANSKTPAYVCVINTRATYIGNHDPDYCRILNSSFLTVPDGKPIEWYAHASGLKQVKKTSGPDLFESICSTTQNEKYTHFLYGSTPEVIQKMKDNLLIKYPNLQIVGAVSPPFGSPEELANDAIVKLINKLKPTFFWLGLGAPKQERVMDLFIKSIDSSILIGVGLVFDYQAGNVKRAPIWMQKAGMEGIYRLIQQPRRVNYRSLSVLFSIVPQILRILFIKKVYGKS